MVTGTVAWWFGNEASLKNSVLGHFGFVIPSAFFLARAPALSGAEGNLLSQRIGERIPHASAPGGFSSG